MLSLQLIVAILLVTVCGIALSYHARLSKVDDPKCGGSVAVSGGGAAIPCASSGDFNNIMVIICLVVGCLFLTYDLGKMIGLDGLNLGIGGSFGPVSGGIRAGTSYAFGRR